MAISVDWTGVATTPYRIFIPKADLTVLQAGPPEILELNVNDFRLALKDLEASEQGILWPNTHDHSTARVLSGVTYARIVEILPPYSVEFEDGQYQVNCVGANHNLGDVKVVNQVSLLIGNSGGLISGESLEKKIERAIQLATLGIVT